MKWILPCLLFVLVGCGSWSKVRPFKKKNVCSDASLEYVKKQSNVKKNDEKRIQNRMGKIESQIKACYKNEVKKETYSKPAFNLCLVMGYDKAGEIDFFEFSTKEYRMSESLVKCLSVIKSSKDLKGLKNVTFIQPYRLTPRR
jgi:uncharacterized protein YxeA